MLDKQALLEQDLHDLKLRFELLEGDRKAYYEQSQLTIKTNKDEISKLRGQNKELRGALAKLKKNSSVDRGSSHGMTELEKLDQQIIELHKKSDDMQAIVRVKEGKLQELRDKLRDLEQEAELVKSAADNSAQAKDMRHLENQLDKAEIKWHEAQTIRMTYEEIVARLQEERQSFDAQLAHFERTLRAKRADASELEMMSRDAHHAKELARSELARIETTIAEDRKRRDKDLVARRELVRQKLESSEKLERELLQVTATDAARGEGAEADKTAAREAADSLAERVAEYEALIRHIKEATGADDLSQVISKFEEQRDTRTRLGGLSTDNEQRLATLRRRQVEMLRELDEALLWGENTGAAAKQAMAELEQQLTDELSRYKETCERHERMLRMLSNVKSGVIHLWDKVKEDKTQKTEVTDNAINAVLDQTMSKIGQLLQTVEGKDIVIEGELSSIPVHLSAHNTRVRLLPAAFESDDNSDGGHGGGNGDDAGADDADDSVVLDRDAIKKATLALLSARNKKSGGGGGAVSGGGGGSNRRRKRGGKDKSGGDDDGDASD